ncbi:hypothetical protein RDV64_11540 [Acuticoccus sp. MNP-M23]|uniref:DUF4870 family protein n=1 Tax=Acuticoccus sp. MNP-M23 TaxID=3072793 RepID=UPI002814D53F|nr:hypothetical protein [Acuticoccus sp. MNP-M23]WMS44974.1 hypothetical protein RDV64_11540 [Acuticoccus sp. MNP-M23]
MIGRLTNKSANAVVSRAIAGDQRTAGKSRPAQAASGENGTPAMARKTAGSVPPTGASAKAAHAQAGRKPKNSGKASAATPAEPTSRTHHSSGTSGADAPKKPRQSLWFRPGAVNVKLIYAGYLASLAMPPVALVAGFFAHQNAKQDPPQWLATHYLYQTRTFWMGLAANIVAYALSFAGVGLLLFPLIAVWLVARSVKGLIRVAQGVEIEEPLSVFV